MGRDVPAANAVLTADGTADGYVTVADNTVFYKAAQAFLTAAGQAPTEVVITEIGATGKIGLRIVTRTPHDGTPGLKPPSYGRSDMSAFTTALGYSLAMPEQFNYNAPT